MSYTRESNANKVSAAQTDILCAFFEENPEVIRGYKKTAKSKDEVQNKWKRVTTQLNVVGPPRDCKSWSKYLCNIKAKLKNKRIQWRQSMNGKEPIMCNTDDFDQIRLRMLQVLRNHSSTHSRDSQETSDSDSEDGNSSYDGHKENGHIYTFSEEIERPSLESLGYIQLAPNKTPPPIPKPPILLNDEFDYFGKNVAQQLRNMPLCFALETQEMILSVLKRQRQKVLLQTSGSFEPLRKY